VSDGNEYDIEYRAKTGDIFKPNGYQRGVVVGLHDALGTAIGPRKQRNGGRARAAEHGLITLRRTALYGDRRPQRFFSPIYIPVSIQSRHTLMKL